MKKERENEMKKDKDNEIKKEGIKLRKRKK